MFRNVASQKLIVYAFDSTTNLPKTGDAANQTAYVSKDYGSVTVLGDTSATEMDSTNAKGYYLFDLTQAETNGDCLLFSAKSSTSNIVVLGMPATVFTTPANFTKMVIDSSGLSDANAVKVGPSGSGTAQTARDLGASVLLAAGQKVDVDTIKTNPVVNAGTVTFPTSATLASTTNITAGTIATVTNLTNAPSSGDFTSTMKTSIGTAVAASAVASVTARVTANADQLAGQTITAAAGVTFPTSVASPTNITAGTITTTTNLTNAPTAGDFTSTMKTSIGTAVAASAVASVTGNVGGSVASISGVTFPSNFSALSIDSNGRVKPLTGLTKNVAISGFMFLMTDATTHAPKMGLTVTSTVSLNAGSFGATVNSAAEVSGGWYAINLAAGDTNGATVALRFTSSGADDTDLSFVTSA